MYNGCVHRYESLMEVSMVWSVDWRAESDLKVVEGITLKMELIEYLCNEIYEKIAKKKLEKIQEVQM